MCTCTVAHNFGVHTQANEYTQHTRDAHHKLALDLPHYTCGVATGTVAVGNEMLQLIGFFICGNGHRVNVLLKMHGLTDYARISLCH